MQVNLADSPSVYSLMKKIFVLLFVCASHFVQAQTQIIHRNPDIASMIAEVSAANLEKHVRDLAAFRTRHSLSANASKEGISASQQYVLAHFQSLIPASGGRLSAMIDTFTVPADGRRIPTDAPMGNVMATLKGTDPQDDRVFIISAHIDSRALDVMNKEIDAPGANDDGSGVAAIMELVRIMS